MSRQLDLRKASVFIPSEKGGDCHLSEFLFEPPEVQTATI